MKKIALILALFSGCLAIALMYAVFMFVGSGKSDYEICIEKQMKAPSMNGVSKQANFDVGIKTKEEQEAHFARRCAQWLGGSQ